MKYDLLLRFQMYFAVFCWKLRPFAGKRRIPRPYSHKPIRRPTTSRLRRTQPYLFVGVHSHVSARYLIRVKDQEEHHSSSGIIISTGVGSSGWLSSLFNMANGMLEGFGVAGKDSIQTLPSYHMEWEAERLVFVVREPFVSKTSAAGIVCGYVTPDAPLVLHSEMPEGGVIFSDGVEADYLAFNAGMIATIGLAQKKTHLVVGNQA